MTSPSVVDFEDVNLPPRDQHPSRSPPHPMTAIAGTRTPPLDTETARPDVSQIEATERFSTELEML